MDALASIHPVPAECLRDGVLAPFIPAYSRYLDERRYAAGTVRIYVYCVAHFARWIRRSRTSVRELSNDVVQRFLDEHLPRCTCPPQLHRSRHSHRASLRHLLVVLDDAGVLSNSHEPSVIEDELNHFDEHMAHARGLAQSTRTKCVNIVRTLLQQTCGASQDSLTLPFADELQRFINLKIQHLKPSSAQSVASALRGYMKFRVSSCGDSVAHLLPLIASPAHWRLAPMPQTLSKAEVTKLLESFRPDLPSRLRAYAMVRCLVDLGLRTGEVVGLTLDDIDWRIGTIQIGKNKSRRVHVLPLPYTTGSAIAEYVRSERPQTANRRIFVRHVAPADAPIKAGVVSQVVLQAYQRCELPYTRAHLLRNTMAARLLGAGGTLKEVADVLRHRDLDTSQIYAKVDTVGLSAVALPWPGSTA